MNPPVGSLQVYALYGDPYAEGWAKDNLKFLHLPKDFDTVKGVSKYLGFWCNRQLLTVFEECFKEIKEKQLVRAIHSFDGCYNLRPIRGGKKPSFHSWGAAIDLNAAEYPLGLDVAPAPDFLEVANIFKSKGFTWGGDFKTRKDLMHFQFGRY